MGLEELVAPIREAKNALLKRIRAKRQYYSLTEAASSDGIACMTAAGSDSGELFVGLQLKSKAQLKEFEGLVAAMKEMYRDPNDSAYQHTEDFSIRFNYLVNDNGRMAATVRRRLYGEITQERYLEEVSGLAEWFVVSAAPQAIGSHKRSTTVILPNELATVTDYKPPEELDPKEATGKFAGIVIEGKYYGAIQIADEGYQKTARLIVNTGSLSRGGVANAADQLSRKGYETAVDQNTLTVSRAFRPAIAEKIIVLEMAHLGTFLDVYGR